MFNTIEEREAWWANKLCDRNDKISAIKDIKETVTLFDGKILNCKFAKAIQNKLHSPCSTDFTYGKTVFYISIYRAESNVTWTYSLRTERCFAKTESGKLRIFAEGFIKELDEYAKIERKEIAELSNVSIRKVRKEFAPIAKAFHDFQEKYPYALLNASGCSARVSCNGENGIHDYDLVEYGLLTKGE